MTPTRVRGSKNYIFDRIFPGVGRIQKSAGTKSRQEFRRRDAILTKLYEAGDLETLRAFKRGQLTIEELVDADRAGRLHYAMERLLLHKPIIELMDAWLPNSAAAKQSRRRYETSWNSFVKKVGIGHHTTLDELARIPYDELKAHYTSPADWNRARALISRFLTKQLGHVHHPFRLEVMAKFPMQAEPEGRMPRITPTTFWAVIRNAEERLQASYVTMVATGTHPAEYLGLTRDDLRENEHLVFVQGTKTRYRRRWVAVDARLWNWIEAGVPSPLHYRWLNNYWKRACEKTNITDFRMNDLRHLSAQYAGDQGATDRDLTIHLGHSDPKMSHRYSRVVTARRVAKMAADRLLEVG